MNRIKIKGAVQHTLALISFIGLVAAAGIATAQEQGAGISLQVGLKGGYSNSTVHSTDRYHEFAEGRNGLSGGMLINTSITKWLDVALEANYARSGANDLMGYALFHPQDPIYQFGSIQNIDLRITSIDIPLLFRVGTNIGNTLAPFVQVGWVWSKYLDAEAIVMRDSWDTGVHKNTLSYYDVTDKLIDSEVAAIFGLGLKARMGKISLIIDGRYRYGFTDMSRATFNEGFNGSSFSLSLGAAYTIK
jgi:hypothetical protein